MEILVSHIPGPGIEAQFFFFGPNFSTTAAHWGERWRHIGRPNKLSEINVYASVESMQGVYVVCAVTGFDWWHFTYVFFFLPANGGRQKWLTLVG